MRRKTVVILTLVLVFALMVTACAVRSPLQTPVQPRQDTTGLYDNNRGIGTNTGTKAGTGTYSGYNTGMDGEYRNDYGNIGGGNNYSNFGMGNAATQGEVLAKSCNTVPGVNNATVVVSGNTAYVGVDTDGNSTGRNVAYGTANDISTVKRQCAQKIKTSNPQIKTVYVSTDANFLERIRSVGNGVKGGSPISNFANELSNLVKGVTPERL